MVNISFACTGTIKRVARLRDRPSAEARVAVLEQAGHQMHHCVAKHGDREQVVTFRSA
jgi:hypothetical protein